MRYLLLFFLFSIYSFGQDPYYISINKSNGLPSNIIYDAIQDSQDFIWFATSKGVCRIDGSQIKNIVSVNYASRPASNLYEDCFGRIWYQDFNGNIFYIKNDVIHKFQKDKANGFLRFGFINNKLFIASKNSINIYDSANFDLIKSVPVDLKDIKQTIVFEDQFYIVGKKIIGFDTKGNSHEIKLPKDHSTNNVAPLLVVNNNELLIFSKYYNYYYKIKNRKIRVFNSPIESNFIQNIVSINGDLWICSTNGVHKYNVENNSLKKYFDDINISSVLKTKTNKYWFSTLDTGMKLVNDIESQFIKTAYMPTKLLATADHLYFGNIKDEILRLDEFNHSKLVHKGNSNHYIHTAHIESDDQILVSSSQFVIHNKGKIHSSPISVKDIFKLDEKYYLLSATSWSGVIYFDPTIKSSFDDYFSGLSTREENGIYFKTIIDVEDGKSCVYNPKDQTIYFITNYGLKSYRDNKLKIIQNQSDITLVKVAVVADKVFCIEDNEVVYNLTKDDNLVTYNFPNNFKNSGIIRIRCHQNELFLVKEDGIYSYDVLENSVTKILRLSKNTEFSDITKIKNTYYVALSEGIIQSKKHLLTSENVKLYLNAIYVNNQLSNLSQLQSLKYNQNNLEINFNIASETLETGYKLFYRINDTNWETLSNTAQSLKLTSLSYGKHELQLQLVNGDEKFRKNILIVIDYPIWFKWWFIVLITLIACALIFMYFKFRIKAINKRNRQAIEKIRLEKHLNQSKLKALKSQMNPHFFFNALNTLQSYILDNDKNNAIKYLSKFSKLTRTILEMSDKDYVNLSEEINTLTIYLDIEQSRFSSDFQYHIHIDEHLITSELYIPSLLLQPHIENSIKHGLLHKEGEKCIEINLTDKEDYILISIEDNGIGRKRSGELNAIKNQNHKSFATESLQQRIDLININLKKKIDLHYIDKENSKGTIVLINIPKHKY